jgi:hypothetical protein
VLKKGIRYARRFLRLIGFYTGSGSNQALLKMFTSSTTSGDKLCDLSFSKKHSAVMKPGILFKACKTEQKKQEFSSAMKPKRARIENNPKPLYNLEIKSKKYMILVIFLEFQMISLILKWILGKKLDC